MAFRLPSHLARTTQEAQLAAQKSFPTYAKLVSEQQKTAAQLQKSERQYQQLFQAHPQPMWVYAQDEGLRILAVNDAMVATYGYSEAELLGMAVSDLWPPGSASYTVTTGECLRQMPSRHQRKDGSFLDVEVSARSIEFNGQKACQIMASDVTERLRAHQEQQRLQAAVIKVAAAVSASSGTEFFIQLARNMADAVGAQAACVARLIPLPDNPHHTEPPLPQYMQPLALVVDGELRDSTEYAMRDMPCLALLTQLQHQVANNIGQQYPQVQALYQDAQSYAGQQLYGSDKKPLGMLCVIFNQPLANTTLVTSTLQIFAARAAAEIERQMADTRIRRQASLLDKAQDAILVRDLQHRILFWNQGAERMYGWTQAQALQQSVAELLYEDPACFYRAHELLLAHGEWVGELVQKHRNGESLDAQVRLTLVRNENGEPESVLSIGTNISQRKAAEREVNRLAFYDALTGLPNRLLLTERMQQALATSQRQQQGGALLFIDMDNFKNLNDTLGHDMGDLLLQQVAQRLNACVRSIDTVARLGGDEFVVVLEALSANAQESRKVIQEIGEAILHSLGQPYKLAQYQYRSTPSIGIAPFLGNQHSVGDLLRHADLAMYQSKAAGRNTLHFFDPQMQAVVLARAELESALRDALAQSQLVLHYQPQVNHLNQFVGVEAMVRWQHPEHGLILPGNFIAAAEESALILTLGRWVLHNACNVLGRWRSHPQLRHLTMAVNISSRQFRHASFVTDVARTLTITGAPAHLLKLELTESLLVEDIESTIATMKTLRDCRVGFSLDDFGTGYSNLRYLKNMPLEQLKIDESFVEDLPTDASNLAIVKTIIGLGEGLDLAVIAEGVESLQQRDALFQAGCHFFQGNLFSEPVPVEALELLLCNPLVFPPYRSE